MRRGVVTAMSGLTIAIVGVSAKAGAALGHHSAALPAGVVRGAQPATGVKSSSTSRSTSSTKKSTKTSSSAATKQPSPASTTATTKQPTQQSTQGSAPRATATPTQGSSQGSTPTPTPTPTPTASSSAITVNGAPADTRYGPVQVQITWDHGRILSSRAIQYPTESDRDQQINSYAIPRLNQETVQAQSSQIDTVSGATYTSDGYRQSLQSAIDAANAAS